MSQGTLWPQPPPPTPGTAAVLTWSRIIHGTAGDRHDWAVAACAALDAGTHVPPFPSVRASTRASREATVRRIYQQASPRAVDPAYDPCGAPPLPPDTRPA